MSVRLLDSPTLVLRREPARVRLAARITPRWMGRERFTAFVARIAAMLVPGPEETLDVAPEWRSPLAFVTEGDLAADLPDLRAEAIMSRLGDAERALAALAELLPAERARLVALRRSLADIVEPHLLLGGEHGDKGTRARAEWQLAALDLCRDALTAELVATSAKQTEAAWSSAAHLLAAVWRASELPGKLQPASILRLAQLTRAAAARERTSE